MNRQNFQSEDWGSDWWHFWKAEWWNLGENPLLGVLLFVGAAIVMLLLFFSTLFLVGVFPV